jgi:hypothetical protein
MQEIERADGNICIKQSRMAEDGVVLLMWCLKSNYFLDINFEVLYRAQDWDTLERTILTTTDKSPANGM